MKKSLLFFIIQLLSLQFAFAQLFTVGSGTTLTVTTGTEVHVKNGDFQNNAGGSIDNAGIIHLTNDWINNGGNNALVANKGTVDFYGSNAQVIKGSDTTVFFNLDLSNGTGIVTINLNTTVGGTGGILTLGARKLNLNSKTLYITNSSLSAISRSSGYIISETPPASGYGNIQWNVNTTTGSFVFPFGSDSLYIPFTYNITTPGTGNGIIKVSTYPTVTSSSPNNRALPTGVSELNDTLSVENAIRVIDRFWPLTVSGYSALPLATLIFTYQDHEWNTTGGSTNVISESGLKAQRWAGFSWIRPALGTTNTTNNTTTVTNTDTFNLVWTLVDETYPLPVTLVSFNATLENNERTRLTWETSNEINTDKFEIWRSENGRDFTYLTTEKTKAPNGVSNTKIDYLTYDPNPYSDMTYYRLKTIDLKGKEVLSEVRLVKRNQESRNSFTIYPNPAGNSLHLFLDVALEDELQYTIINSNGMQVVHNSITLKPGINNFTEDISSLSAGVYYLYAHSKFKNYDSMKLIVIR